MDYEVKDRLKSFYDSYLVQVTLDSHPDNSLRAFAIRSRVMTHCQSQIPLDIHSVLQY